MKTHAPPSTSLRFLLSINCFRATYIYRDPRDVVISAFEHGQKIRSKGESHTFGRLDSIDASITFVKRLVAVWDEWMQCGQVLVVRYEDLITDPVKGLKRLARFLSLDVLSQDLHEIVATYQTDRAREKGIIGLHLNKGTVGRFRAVMTKRELGLCDKHFGDYLEKMGYSE